MSSCEVGGRWSGEDQEFLRSLAKAKARSRQAWRHRWVVLLACSAAKAVAVSLVERPGGLGSDGATPTSSEVVGEACTCDWQCACPHVVLFLCIDPFLRRFLAKKRKNSVFFHGVMALSLMPVGPGCRCWRTFPECVIVMSAMPQGTRLVRTTQERECFRMCVSQGIDVGQRAPSWAELPRHLQIDCFEGTV